MGARGFLILTPRPSLHAVERGKMAEASYPPGPPPSKGGGNSQGAGEARQSEPSPRRSEWTSIACWR